jgi:hypothetical protein
MRRFILCLFITFFIAIPIESGAKVVKHGNTWVQVDSAKTKKQKPQDPKVGTFKDKEGKTYDVFQGPKGGYYYIKNGKKRYLPKK